VRVIYYSSANGFYNDTTYDTTNNTVYIDHRLGRIVFGCDDPTKEILKEIAKRNK